jgi:hypothetical protein
MQVIIHTIFKKGSPSIRKLITENANSLTDYELRISFIKKNSRPNGWASLKKKGTKGSLTLAWAPQTTCLTGRVISKEEPANELLGTYLDFLTKHFHTKIITTIITYQ